jgi:hypothetical protein
MYRLFDFLYLRINAVTYMNQLTNNKLQKESLRTANYFNNELLINLFSER